MNKSELIFHTIALVILAIVIVLFWNFISVNPDADDKTTSDAIGLDSTSTVRGFLYRIIPIFCGVILFSIAIAFYLEEWLPETSWQYRIIERIIAILASIPSLVYGLIGIYFFIKQTEDSSYFAHTLIVVLLVVPVTIQSTQKAIQGVDISVREAAYALGTNRSQVVADHVFPHAFPAILAGIFTAISRVFAIAAFIVVFYQWINHTVHSGTPFNIPSSVVVLLLSALFSSVISSYLLKKAN